MMIRRWAIIPFLLCFGVMEAAEIHVSPTGKDENKGTVSAPVQTLERARMIARQARKAAPDKAITIQLHPGKYTIRDTVVFTKEDSGTPKAPLQIQAWQDSKRSNARPHLIGGIEITGWKKTTFNHRNDVWEADLKPLGITKKFRQLYLNGTRQIWSRYPNFNPDLPYSGGWIYVEGVRPPMYTDIPGEPLDQVVLRKKDVRDWSRPDEGEICIFPRYNWWNCIEKIKQFDPNTRTFTLDRKMHYAARPEDRFALFGLKEELDAPGEWYQDVDKQKVYFIPPEGVDPNKQTVSIPTVTYPIVFENVSYVTIRGVEMSCSEGGAIRMVHCDHCSIEKSLIHDMGYFAEAGVSIIQGRNCVVRGCDIWHIGGHGVNVTGGDSVKMIKCEHLIDNCYIHHVGQFNRHGIGIMMGGTGITVSHNLIHDMPRCGIFYGGVLHTVEYNRIRHCNLEMEDTGCTYGGGWTGGWTTIRCNHCSDSIGFNNHGKFFAFAWGIYLDESGCGYDVYGNIVERCQIGAMHLHNARENHIFNNIFVNNAGPEGKSHQISLQSWDNSPNGVFLRDRQPKMLDDYNRLIANPEWKKMRGMDVSPADPFLPDGSIMRGNRIERNIFYYPEQPESKYAKVSRVNLKANPFDRNLLWNGGKVPIKTESIRSCKTTDDVSNKIPNRQFVPASASAMKNVNQTAVDSWYWYHKTFPDMRMELVSVPVSQLAPDSSGSKTMQRFMRIPGRYNPEQPHIKFTCFKSADFAIDPGKSYRLSFKWRTAERQAPLIARFVSENNGLWKPFGTASFHCYDDKMRCDSIMFHYPKPGEPEYDARLGKVNIQFEFHSKQGTADLGDLVLEEVADLDSWQSWQKMGADVHSIVADPLFEDAANGNYRLKRESPAFSLGFKQIPIDRIGPYSDSARVTWPIQEASGVREHPDWLTSVPIP